MSWRTVQLVQGLAPAIDSMMQGITSRQLARKDDESLRAQQQLLGPEVGMPTGEQLESATAAADEAKKKYDLGMKSWEDFLKAKPVPMPGMDPAQKESYLNTLDAQNAKTAAALRQSIAADRRDFEQKRKTLTDLEAQHRRFQDMNRADWQDYFRTKYQEKTPAGKSDDYSVGKRMDDAARWYTHLSDSLLMARSDPTNKAYYDMYLQAADFFKRAGGNYTPISPQELAPLTKDEKNLLSLAWERLFGRRAQP